MREIEFRGKCLDNGGWVKGWLTYNRLDNLLNRIDTKECCYCVIPETVSQYTGLKDKNGVKIFEGDIIKGDIDFSTDERVGLIGKIIFSSGIFCFARPTQIGLDVSALCTLHNIEVIGNIHDNPELLKEADND